MQAVHKRSTVAQRNRFSCHIRPWHFAACLLLTALVGLCLQFRAGLPSSSSTHQQQALALDGSADAPDESFAVDDSLVQQIVQRCMQQQDTFIWVQQRQVAVWDDTKLHLRPGGLDQRCGLFHIPLAGSDRSIGLCTDAALYVQLLGGWIAPASQHGLQHAQACGLKSAVLFLEPLYDSWLNWLEQQQHVVAVYAPNFEQVFGYDRTAHQRMRVVLCKVRRCQELMSKYLEEIHSTATMIYTGARGLHCWFACQAHMHKGMGGGGGVSSIWCQPGCAVQPQHQQQQDCAALGLVA